MSLARARIEQAAQLVDVVKKHPLIRAEVRTCLELLVLILGELDDRLTAVERSTDGDRRQAR